MTLQKALKTDGSSENSEIDPKHQNLLRSFYNNESESHGSPTGREKGRIKKLLWNHRSVKNFGLQSLNNQRGNAISSRIQNNISEESVEDDAYFIKNSEGYKIEVITDEMRANNFTVSVQSNNRNLNTSANDESAFNSKSKIKKCSSSNTKQMDSLVDIHHEQCKGTLKPKKRVNMLTNLKVCIKDLKLIQKIQRNVKKWLLKRQACDISHASDVIQKELNKSLLKKNGHACIDQKEAVILIQRTVRNWLAEK